MATNKAAWIGGAAVLGLGYYLYRRRKKTVPAVSGSANPAPFEVYPTPEAEVDNVITFPAVAR